MHFWLFPEFLQGAIDSNIIVPFHCCCRTRYQFMIQKRYIKLRLCLFSVVFPGKKKDFVLCIFRDPLNFYKVQIQKKNVSANYENFFFQILFPVHCCCKTRYQFRTPKAYSQICIKRSPLGQTQTCLLLKEVQFNSIFFYYRTTKRGFFNTDDCLIGTKIEVTPSAGLTVLN